MILHLNRQLQPQADATITRHPPGCSLLIVPDGVADPGVWGSCNSPPLMKVTGQHWPLFSTPLCLKAKLSYGPNLHLSADCCKRLLRSLGGKKWGGTCCDFVKSGLDWVTQVSLHRGTLDWNSLTPSFTMKIYPFFEYLQFAIKILTWRDRCNFIGYDSSNPFVQFSGL